MKPTIYEYKANLKHFIRLTLIATGLRYDTIDGYFIGNNFIKVKAGKMLITMSQDLNIISTIKLPRRCYNG
jgi:hypothetical protein